MLRLFKNKLFWLAAVTVGILIVIGMSASPNSKLHFIARAISVPLSPVQRLFSYIGRGIEDNIRFLMDMKELDGENKRLKERIDQLEWEVKQLNKYREENKELRETLNLKDQFGDYESIGGNIIAKDMGNWFNVFTIDRGSSDGVTVNSPVITSKGLVGVVISVTPFTSKVMTVIDEDSTVSAVVTKSMDVVIVKGDIFFKEYGLCRMDYIDAGTDIAVGDTIETSGLGGIFPRGILVGRVKAVGKTENNLTKYAVIEPAVDFKRLQEVFVLINKEQNADGTGSAKK